MLSESTYRALEARVADNGTRVAFLEGQIAVANVERERLINALIMAQGMDPAQADPVVKELRVPQKALRRMNARDALVAAERADHDEADRLKKIEDEYQQAAVAAGKGKS